MISNAESPGEITSSLEDELGKSGVCWSKRKRILHYLIAVRME